MTMITGQTGKRGELHVFGQLLERGIVPYVPLVDLEGIDCLVRKQDGTYIELQVKTLNTPSTPMWWQVTKVPQRANYYYALVSIPLGWDTWIMSASDFLLHASGPTGPRQNIYDLDL